MTATVETVSEQLDLASILPSEKTMPAFAKAIALSDADVGKYKSSFSWWCSNNVYKIIPTSRNERGNFAVISEVSVIND